MPTVAQKYRFGVLGSHDLKEKMMSKGVSFAPECRVFEICNPQQAKSVLEQSMEVSTALPCRISVYQDGADTVLATVKPTALLGLFGAESVSHVALEVENSMENIMTDICAPEA